MTYSRNESGMARESVRNGSGLARTRARARRGALETGDRRDGLRLHANLTVGAPDAPAISRPDVADVGMPIEHLDFEPPCDSRRRLAHPVDSLPPATHQWRKGCCGLLRLSCWSCVVKVLSSSPGTCPDCGFLFYDMADYVTGLRSLR